MNYFGQALLISKLLLGPVCFEDTNEHNELSEKFYLNDSSEVKEQLAELLGSQHISLIKK